MIGDELNELVYYIHNASISWYDESYGANEIEMYVWIMNGRYFC